MSFLRYNVDTMENIIILNRHQSWFRDVSATVVDSYTKKKQQRLPHKYTYKRCTNIRYRKCHFVYIFMISSNYYTFYNKFLIIIEEKQNMYVD